MNIAGGIILLLTAVLMALVLSVLPKQSRLTSYELDRRRKAELAGAQLEFDRAEALDGIRGLQRTTFVILLVVATASATAWLGVWLGTAATLGILTLVGLTVRWRLLRGLAQMLYLKYEAPLITWSLSHRKKLAWFYLPPPRKNAATFHSKAELEQLLVDSPGVLSADQRWTVLHSLTFYERLVGDCMTLKQDVDLVKAADMLGPLLLDELHKTGHNFFPVVDTDLDSTIGILQLSSSLTVDTTNKHTATAKRAMSKEVYYLNQNQTLAAALSMFLKHHHQLAIVVNSEASAVGIITLGDVLNQLVVTDKSATDNLSADNRQQIANYL